MYKIHHIDKNQFIAYNIHKSNEKDAPCIIFTHGLLSNMHSTKPVFIEKYCIERDYNFIRFDNLGRGDSSGNFFDQTISSWLAALMSIIDNFANSKTFLVGSSLGGWLSLLAGKKLHQKIKGIIAIASAADFTEEAIWQQLSKSDQQKMINGGKLNINIESCQYQVNYQLIKDARKHLLLNKESVDINCGSICLIHGMLDESINYDVSIKLCQKINNENITLKLIKDGNHLLTRNCDLKIIINSLEEAIELNKEST